MITPEPRDGLALIVKTATARQGYAVTMTVMRQACRTPARFHLRREARRMFWEDHPRPPRLRARDLLQQADQFKRISRLPWISKSATDDARAELLRRAAYTASVELYRMWGVLVTKGRGRALARGVNR